MQETNNDKNIYGEHPGLLPIELQNNFDDWMQVEMNKCLGSETALRARIQSMSSMIRLLDTLRKSREKDEWKEPSEESIQAAEKLKEHIDFFNANLWPQIQGAHEGIITDDKNPFRIFENSNITRASILEHFSSSDRVADSTDLLRELVENEQHEATYITRDMTKLVSRNETLTTMLSKRRQRESETAIRHMGEGR
jgi:hypothetical protein